MRLHLARLLCLLGLTADLGWGLRIASRRDALKLSSLGLLQLLWQDGVQAEELQEKQRNLSAEQIRGIVEQDLLQRQFLATADFTRSIYDESCIFTDEIDSYSLPKFVAGTKKLFVADKSHVDLVGEVTIGGQATFFNPLCSLLSFLIRTRSNRFHRCKRRTRRSASAFPRCSPSTSP